MNTMSCWAFCYFTFRVVCVILGFDVYEKLGPLTLLLRGFFKVLKNEEIGRR